MKNRRIVLITFMLAAVLTLGVGFAAYSTTLTIGGTTAVSQEAVDFTQSVKFVSANSDDESFGKAAVAADGHSASFDVFGMSSSGQHVSFEYVVENNSDYDILLDITTHPVAAKNDPNFVVTTTLSSSAVAKGTSTIVTVEVVLRNDVASVVNPINWTIQYTAVSVDP